MKKLVMIVLCLGMLGLMPGTASAASVSGYHEGWDVPNDLAGWTANTIISSVSQTSYGGNPDGLIGTGGYANGSFDVGAMSELAAITGNFIGQIWTVSVDLAFVYGNVDNAWLRLRYLDGTQNGWVYSLTSSAFSPAWNSFSVTFDPSWSDAEARAHGWLTDLEAVSPTADPSVSWSQTMSDVYTTEVRISGEGFVGAWIDNFRLTTAAVPEPASLLLVGAGLAGLAAFRRTLRR